MTDVVSFMEAPGWVRGDGLDLVGAALAAMLLVGEWERERRD
jgi:hypothetical protein